MKKTLKNFENKNPKNIFPAEMIIALISVEAAMRRVEGMKCFNRFIIYELPAKEHVSLFVGLAMAQHIFIKSD